MIIKSIYVNAWQAPIGDIRVIQEEADGREIEVTVIGADNQPLDLTGKIVSVYMQKPDNTIIYNSCVVSGSTVTIELTGQMMAVSGHSKFFELQIVDTDSHTLKVSLPTLCIIPSNYDGAIESTDEFSQLTEALVNVNESISDAEEAATAANAAAGAANNAASTANSAAESANEAAQAALDAAQGFSVVTDPTTGQQATVQTALNNIYNWVVAAIYSPLSAAEYDALGLTATAYDAKNITAQDYDTKSRTILIGG